MKHCRYFIFFYLFFTISNIFLIKANEKNTSNKEVSHIKKIDLCSLKKFIYPKICKSGLEISPNQRYGVYVFCDDAAGTTIGVINLTAYEHFSGKNEWDLHRRFWQEEEWARDILSIEWSEDGSSLTIITNNIYGTGKIYTLDLENKKVLSTTISNIN